MLTTGLSPSVLLPGLAGSSDSSKDDACGTVVTNSGVGRV